MVLLIQQFFVASEVLGFLGVIPWGQEAETDKKYKPTGITMTMMCLKLQKLLLGQLPFVRN